MAAQMKARDEQDRVQYEETRDAAKIPSAAEVQREAERKAYFDWKAKGDFRTPPPSLIGVSFGPEAEKRRQMERTATPTGAAGMGAGYASPTALAMTREYLGNVNAENDALAYQGALGGEDLYQRTNNSSALMNSDFMRKMGLLTSSQNQSQFQTGARIQTTPQSILPALISGGLQAGGQIASAKIMVACVTLDTEVLTPSGFVPIANLHEGDLVIGVSYIGERLELPITRERTKMESEIVRITNENGSMECSPSDRIMASANDHSERVASELVEGEVVEGGAIVSIERLTEKKPVKIIKLGSQSENFGFIDSIGIWHLDDYKVLAATNSPTGDNL